MFLKLSSGGGEEAGEGDLVGWVSFTQLAEWISSARGFLLTCGLFFPRTVCSGDGQMWAFTHGSLRVFVCLFVLYGVLLLPAGLFGGSL